LARQLVSTPSNGVDTLVIGGGVMGSSVAYHLAAMRGTGDGIVVVERDASYQRASAVLSAGGIRQQFSLRENVQMSICACTPALTRHAVPCAVFDPS